MRMRRRPRSSSSSPMAKAMSRSISPSRLFRIQVALRRWSEAQPDDGCSGLLLRVVLAYSVLLYDPEPTG